MSLASAKMSGLTMRPWIRETRNTISISTGMLTSILTLFLMRRKTVISLSGRQVFMTSRMGYFFKSMTILDFHEISHVDYEFDSVGTDYGWTGGGFGRQDQYERFSISLVTKSNQRHFLCSFKGEGSVCTGWGGILLGHKTYPGDGTFQSS